MEHRCAVATCPSGHGHRSLGSLGCLSLIGGAVAGIGGVYVSQVLHLDSAKMSFGGRHHAERSSPDSIAKVNTQLKRLRDLHVRFGVLAEDEQGLAVPLVVSPCA